MAPSDWTPEHGELLERGTRMMPLLDALSLQPPRSFEERYKALLRSEVQQSVETLPRGQSALESAAHFREGMAASRYHLENAQEMEREGIEFIQRTFGSETGHGTMGIRLQKLNFENFAFHFALRRSLEYLARAVASLYGRDVRSFKRLDRALSDAEPREGAEAVIAEWREAKRQLGDILSEDEYKTPRDLAAHREAISAGTLNAFFLPQGGIAVELLEGSELTLDLERMRRGELRLAPQMCEQLERVIRVGLGLLETAIDGCSPGAERRSED